MYTPRLASSRFSLLGVKRHAFSWSGTRDVYTGLDYHKSRAPKHTRALIVSNVMEMRNKAPEQNNIPFLFTRACSPLNDQHAIKSKGDFIWNKIVIM